MNTFFILKRLLFVTLLTISILGYGQNKIALVIGNSKYTDNTFPQLSTPVSDAREIDNKLRQLGFSTIVVYDANKQELLNAINRFNSQSRKADVGVFYYSGHATNIKYTNYLVPCKTSLNIATLSDECVNLSNIISLMNKNCKLSLLFLDACRSEVAVYGQSKGIITPSIPTKTASNDATPTGCMVFYATENGRPATTGYGRISPFTQSLSKFLLDNREFRKVWSSISNEVSNNTDKTQIPVCEGTYSENFYFNKNGKSSGTNPIDNNKVSITFNVYPSNAKLYFGEKSYSIGTPLNFTKGDNYNYKITAEGYQTQIGTLEVNNSTPSTINISLQKAETASLRVTCDNRHGARIYLDGEYKGWTPLTINTTTGTHVLKYDGGRRYYNYETKLNVTSGTNRINRHLNKVIPEWFDWENEGGNIASYHYSPKYQIGLSYLFRPEDWRFSFGAMVASSTGFFRGWSNPLSINIKQTQTIVIGGSNGNNVDEEGNKTEVSYENLTKGDYSSDVDPYNEAKHYESNVLLLANLGYNPCLGIMIEAGLGAGYHRDLYYMENTYSLKKTIVTNTVTGDVSAPSYEYVKNDDSHWYKQNTKWSPAFRLGTKFFIPVGPLGDYEGYLSFGGGYTYLTSNKKYSSWDANIGLSWCF